MIQQITIILAFIAAVAYLGRMVFRSFQTKKGCDTNCKCDTAKAINFPKN